MLRRASSGLARLLGLHARPQSTSAPSNDKNAALAKTLYRAFLSISRSLDNGALHIRLPVRASEVQWGVHGREQFGFVPDRAAAEERLDPSLAPALSAPVIQNADLREIIRSSFRSALARDDAIDLGLNTLRELNLQLEMVGCLTSTIKPTPCPHLHAHSSRSCSPRQGGAVRVEATSE